MSSKELTKEEATAALTLIDASVKMLGLKILAMPGSFLVLERICRKLEAAQQPPKGEEQAHGNDQD